MRYSLNYSMFLLEDENTIILVDSFDEWFKVQDIKCEIEINQGISENQYIFGLYEMIITFDNDEDYALFLLSFAHEF